MTASIQPLSTTTTKQSTTTKQGTTISSSSAEVVVEEEVVVVTTTAAAGGSVTTTTSSAASNMSDHQHHQEQQQEQQRPLHQQDGNDTIGNSRQLQHQPKSITTNTPQHQSSSQHDIQQQDTKLLRHDEQVNEDYYDGRYNSHDDMNKNRLIFHSKKRLYGRDDELAILHSIYQRMIQQQRQSAGGTSTENPNCGPQIVFVKGYAGTGKSALLQEFQHQLLQQTRHDILQRNNEELELQRQQQQREKQIRQQQAQVEVKCMHRDEEAAVKTEQDDAGHDGEQQQQQQQQHSVDDEKDEHEHDESHEAVAVVEIATAAAEEEESPALIVPLETFFHHEREMRRLSLTGCPAAVAAAATSKSKSSSSKSKSSSKSSSGKKRMATNGAASASEGDNVNDSDIPPIIKPRFVCGKYEELASKSLSSYSAISNGLIGFFSNLLNNNDTNIIEDDEKMTKTMDDDIVVDDMLQQLRLEEISTLQYEVEKAVGDYYKVLAELVPNLAHLFDDAIHQHRHAAAIGIDTSSHGHDHSTVSSLTTLNYHKSKTKSERRILADGSRDGTATSGDENDVLLNRSSHHDGGGNGGGGTTSSSTVTSLTNNKENARKVNILRHVFRNLLKALCKNSQFPLILWLDDIQWMDISSMELLSTLLSVNDASLQNLMVIGSYRSNEVQSSNHKLSAFMKDLQQSQQQQQQQGEDSIVTIDLPDLSLQHITEFITDTLRYGHHNHDDNDEDEEEDGLDYSSSRSQDDDDKSSSAAAGPLAKAIYTKTLGNIFYTMQALEELVRKNALFYDVMTFQWQYNIKDIQQSQLDVLLSKDVIAMVQSKIRNLASSSPSPSYTSTTMTATSSGTSSSTHKAASLKMPSKSSTTGTSLIDLLSTSRGLLRHSNCHGRSSKYIEQQQQQQQQQQRWRSMIQQVLIVFAYTRSTLDVATLYDLIQAAGVPTVRRQGRVSSSSHVNTRNGSSSMASSNGSYLTSTSTVDLGTTSHLDEEDADYYPIEWTNNCSMQDLKRCLDLAVQEGLLVVTNPSSTAPPQPSTVASDKAGTNRPSVISIGRSIDLNGNDDHVDASARGTTNTRSTSGNACSTTSSSVFCWNSSTNKEYSFAHDRIQEASQGLLDNDEEVRYQLLYRLAHELEYKSTTSRGEEWMLFTAVHHLNSLPVHIIGGESDPTSLIQLSKLNLRAAKVAMDRSAFTHAVQLLRCGVDDLNHCGVITINARWRCTPKASSSCTDNSSTATGTASDSPKRNRRNSHIVCNISTYQHCLDLFHNLLEMEFTVGNHDAAQDAIHQVLANTVHPKDKLVAQFYDIEIATSTKERDYDRAIAKSVKYLASHGVKIPSHPSEARLAKERIGLQLVMSRARGAGGASRVIGVGGSHRTNNALLDLLDVPPMDEYHEQIMRLIAQLTDNSLLGGNVRLATMANLIAQKLSWEQGISVYLPSMLPHYGALLRKQGKLLDACKVAVAAEEMLHKICEGPSWVRGMHVCHTAVTTMRVPYSSSIDVFSEVHRVGVSCGDCQWGLLAAMMYCHSYYASGWPVNSVFEAKIIQFEEESRSFGLSPSLVVTFGIFRQTLLNLQGSGIGNTIATMAVDDPSRLKGKAFDEDEALAQFAGNDTYYQTLRDISTYRLMLAFIYDDESTMVDMLERLMPLPEFDLCVPRQHMRDLFMGFAALVVVRSDVGSKSSSTSGQRKKSTSKKKLLKLARQKYNEFQRLAKVGSPNAPPALACFRAEERQSKTNYDKAIRSCSSSGMMHLEALMNERCGLYLLDQHQKQRQRSDGRKKKEGQKMDRVEDNVNALPAEYKAYLTNAMWLYYDYGAMGKVNWMRKNHSFLNGASARRQEGRTSSLFLTPSRFSFVNNANPSPSHHIFAT